MKNFIWICILSSAQVLFQIYVCKVYNQQLTEDFKCDGKLKTYFWHELLNIIKVTFTPPGRFLVLISVEAGSTPGPLGKLKKIHLIGTWTRDLAVCSIVHQPTTLPRACC
jgi:hypothetical protein